MRIRWRKRDIIAFCGAAILLLSTWLSLYRPPALAQTDTAQPRFVIDWTSEQPEPVSDLLWGDVDNDGDLDLFVATATGGDAAPPPDKLYLNTNGALSTQADWLSPPRQSRTGHWADFNGDGWLDLALTHGEVIPTSVAVYLNDGDGRLQTAPAWRSAAIHDGITLYVADATGDRQFDLIATGWTTRTLVFAATENEALFTDTPAIIDTTGRVIGVADVDANRAGLELLLLQDNALQLATLDADLQLEPGEPACTVDPFRFQVFGARWVPGTAEETHLLVLSGAMPNAGARGASAPGVAVLPTFVDRADCDLERTPNQLFQVTGAASWADVNADGRLDFTSPRTIYLQSASSTPSFSASGTAVQPDAALTRWADVDGDGDLDAVTAGDRLPLRLWRNDLSLWEPDPSLAKSEPEFENVSWADFDGDGDWDRLRAPYFETRDVALDINVGGTLSETKPFAALPIVSADTAPIIRTFAWTDLADDGHLDVAIGTYGQGIQLFQNDGAGGFLSEPVWESSAGDAASALAWGDFNRDGYLDLAVGTHSYGQPGWRDATRDRVLITDPDSGTLGATTWLAEDLSDTDAVRWVDVDQDGDLDLVAADANTPFERVYFNDRGALDPNPRTLETAFVRPPVARTLHADDTLFRLTAAGAERYTAQTADPSFAADAFSVTIMERARLGALPRGVAEETIYAAAADPPAAAGYYDDGRVAFVYTLSGSAQRAYDVAGAFSIDGGQTWSTATPTTDTTWQQIGPGQHSFSWDYVADGIAGRNDDVRFRLRASPRSPQAPQPFATAGIFQQAAAVRETLPFRVYGTELRLVDATGAGVSGGVVYSLREDGVAGRLLGSSLTGHAFTTDETGLLSGRAPLAPGDLLFAAQPVAHGYRIPPQLALPDGTPLTRAAVTDAASLTALAGEMWLYPQSDAATLLALGDNARLAYSGVDGSTTLSLTIAGASLTVADVPLADGAAHHLAFSWTNTGATTLYLNGVPIADGTLAAGVILSRTAPLILGEQYVGTIDEIRLWRTERPPNTDLIFGANAPFATSDTSFINTLSAAERENLIAYWPVTHADETRLDDHSGNGNHLTLPSAAAIIAKPLYTLYHTSGALTDAPQPNARHGVVFAPTAAAGGVQTLTVSADNPLLLFDLDVSLEWDARADSLFLQQLDNSFRDASALLYDVTDGQVALGQINLFHAKAFWGTADIVIHADNSLRPSAAIGGVANVPVDDLGSDTKPPYPDAYRPGQVRMGPAWDPYGESTTDLEEDWTRALAHELAHYLLFLPDNYLGLKCLVEDCADSGAKVLRQVVCPGSFMTTTSNPAVTELLREAGWLEGECPDTLAANLTGRNDWETVTAFYPMLRDPATTPALDGPTDLPLAVTYLVPWAPETDRTPFTTRNFDVRDAAQQRLRLPDAQVFLFQTQDTADPSDDVVVPLGNPTGGGDRIRVRGATAGDRICLFDAAYAGCIEDLRRETVTLNVAPVAGGTWRPDVSADSADGRTVTVAVDQTVAPGETIWVQLYPMHYGPVPDNAPLAALTGSGNRHQATLSLALPAYELAVRVWVGDGAPDGSGRELVSIVHLNPTAWDEHAAAVQTPVLVYTPLPAGPNSTIVGGPNSTIVGGPNSTIVGGPNSTIVGGPNSTIVGGPYSTIVGGPNSTIVGGTGRVVLGGPNSTIVGGPNSTIVGGPNSTIVGGGNVAAAAPIASADAHVTIYSQRNIFDDNGVAAVQALATLPCGEQPWFMLVGQPYRVRLETADLDRFITVSYLQRRVPPGYEHTLALYFLPDGAADACAWQRLAESEGFVENIVVAPLRQENGVYALFATVGTPPLQPGWNLFTYPLPGSRAVTDALSAIDGRYDPARVVSATVETEQVTITAAALNIRRAPDTSDSRLGFLLRGAIARVIDSADGWWQIECPPTVAGDTCWISSRYTTDLGPVPVQGQTPATTFTFGRHYWIYVTADEPVTVYLAPPTRNPDGTLQR